MTIAGLLGRIPRDVGVVFIGNLFARGLGFLYPVVLARALPSADFALAYFFINTGFAVGEIVLVGYPTALTRYLAAVKAGERSGWVASAILPAIPLLVVSIIGGELLADRGKGSVALMSVVIVGLTIDAFYFAILRGLGRFGLLVLYRIAANAAQLILLAALAFAGVVTVPIAAGIYALSYLVPIIVIELRTHLLGSLVDRHSVVTRARIMTLTRFALPAIVSGTAYAGLLGIDVFFMRIFAPAELPAYAAARTLAMPMSLVPYAIGVTILPRAAQERGSRRRRLLRDSLVAALLLAAIGVAAYVVAAPILVGLLYPSGYEGASRLLPALALAVGGTSVYSILSQWWLGIGRPVLPAFALVVGAAASVACHLTLTRATGGIGAATAICLGAIVAATILGGATLLGRDRPTAARATAGGPAASDGGPAVEPPPAESATGPVA